MSSLKSIFAIIAMIIPEVQELPLDLTTNTLTIATKNFIGNQFYHLSD